MGLATPLMGLATPLRHLSAAVAALHALSTSLEALLQAALMGRLRAHAEFIADAAAGTVAPRALLEQMGVSVAASAPTEAEAENGTMTMRIATRPLVQ